MPALPPPCVAQGPCDVADRLPGKGALPSSLPHLSPSPAPPCSSDPPGPVLLNRVVVIVLKYQNRHAVWGLGIIGNIVIRNYEKHFYNIPSLVNAPQRRQAAGCPGHRSSTEIQASESSWFAPSSNAFHITHRLADTKTCKFA